MLILRHGCFIYFNENAKYKNTNSTIQGVRENAISFLMGDQYYSLVTIMHVIPKKRNIIS